MYCCWLLSVVLLLYYPRGGATHHQLMHILLYTGILREVMYQSMAHAIEVRVPVSGICRSLQVYS